MKKLLTVLNVALVASLALAYSGGPPDGKTGAPGEGTCVDCHSTYPLNSGNGELAIEAPATFVPGQTYAISVHLSDPDQSRWGFELTPLDAGNVNITDPTNTQLSNSGNNMYVKHTTTGTYNGTNDGPVTWTFDWTAPADNPPSSVTLYAAGNAANASFDNSGDYIYTTSATINLATGIDDFNDGLLPNILALESYPNPFNAVANIRYGVPDNGQVSLDIYDIQGRMIAQLENGYKTAGIFTTSWNGRDGNGNEVVSGIYFVRLSVDAITTTQRLVLLK